MKRLFIFLILLVCNYELFAQIEVTVGTGTLQSTTGSYPNPYSTFLYGSRHQFIIPASEIISAGGFAGNITALGFDVANISSFLPMTDYTVHIGTTTATSLGTWQTGPFTQVYYTAIYIETPGWNMHVFNSPYYWDGVSNIIVETCFNNTIASSIYSSVKSTATTYIASMWRTGSGVCGLTGSDTASQRPNIKFRFASNLALDAGIHVINSPVIPVDSGTHAVTATLMNHGTDTLTSSSVYWSVNGVIQTPYAWTGSLATASSSIPLLLGSFNFPSGTNTIKAWSTAPNNGIDSFPGNDTATAVINFVSSLNGTYTIGGATANFPTFNDALSDMISAGISGPVLFNVNPGTYIEQVTFPVIPGSSPTNTITFQSTTGDSTSVLLQYAALAAADNWVVRFSGTTNVTFKQMTIESTSTSGRVFVMLSDSKRITITNCIVKTNNTSTSGLSAGIFSAPANIGTEHLMVTNNVFIGGNYSIYWFGLSATKKNHMVVENNIMSDFYLYGIYCYYVDSVYIRYNSLINRSTSGSTWAINVFYNTGASEIFGNKIHLQGGGSSHSKYGIRSGFKQVIDTTPMLIANNFVSQIGSTGTVYGIYLLTTNYVDVYNNSVRVGNGSAGGRALYASGGTNLNIINNSLANFGGGYAITGSSTNIINCNYNNLYTTGVNLGSWGSSNKTSLIAWQTASGKDSNSISIDPQYTSINDLHTAVEGMWQNGTPLASVPLDIDKEPRNPLAPCIGADEYILNNNDAGVLEMTEPLMACHGILTNVMVKIKNFGIQSFTGLTVNWTVNGVAQTPYIYTSVLAPNADTTILMGSFIFYDGISYDLMFYTSNPNNTTDQNPLNDTLTVTGFQTLPKPNSLINALGPLSFSQGDSVILKSVTNDELTCEWMLNGNIIVGATDTVFIANQPGNYTLIITDSFGCKDTSSVTSVIVNPLPPASITAGGVTEFCQGDTLWFTANSGFGLTHQWFRNGIVIQGAVNSQFGSTQEGQYHVMVTDTNACEKESDTLAILFYIPYEGENICAVTLDSATGKNMVVWEKTSGERIMQYNIYREGFVTGQYSLLGTSPYNDFSAFVDTSSNPLQQSYRYSIAILDSCSNESSKSPPHKTIHLSSNIGPNGEINLLWTAYEGASYQTHRVLRSNYGGSFILIGQVAGNMYSYSDLTPPVGQNRYFVEIEVDGGCFPTIGKGADFSTIRSNMVSMNVIGIAEYESHSSIKIFPNPSHGSFTIEFSEPPAHNQTLEIYDPIGRVVRFINIPKYSRQLIIYEPDLSPGLYYLRINGLNWQKRIQIIK